MGGAELALVEGVDALAARGHEVHVVLPGWGPLAGPLGVNATIHVCKHKPWLTFERSIVTRAEWMTYNALVSAPRIAAIARRIHADVVLSNTVTTMVGGIAARSARVPHVWFAHEYGREDHGLPFVLGRRLTFLVMRTSMRLCIVNSEAMRSVYREWLLGIDVRVARYAVNVPEPRPRSADDGRLRLILVGTKKPSKGQRDAIQAVASLVSAGLDVGLDLVGGGEPAYEQLLRDTARALGIADRVRFISFHPDPFSLVCDADIVLMCSRAEALGRVTVEGMKAGKPIVGAAGGATPELVQHGWNGYLYRPGDANDLAKWLKVCCRDRDGLREMGRRGQQWAGERFNEESYGAALEDAVCSAVAGPS